MSIFNSLALSISLLSVSPEFQEMETLVVRDVDNEIFTSAKRELAIKMMRLILIEVANNEDDETIRNFFEQ
jgi:hypothetical protein